jgi:hypothetical protein
MLRAPASVRPPGLVPARPHETRGNRRVTLRVSQRLRQRLRACLRRQLLLPSPPLASLHAPSPKLPLASSPLASLHAPSPPTSPPMPSSTSPRCSRQCLSSAQLSSGPQPCPRLSHREPVTGPTPSLATRSRRPGSVKILGRQIPRGLEHACLRLALPLCALLSPALSRCRGSLHTQFAPQLTATNSVQTLATRRSASPYRPEAALSILSGSPSTH